MQLTPKFSVGDIVLCQVWLDPFTFDADMAGNPSRACQSDYNRSDSRRPNYPDLFSPVLADGCTAEPYTEIIHHLTTLKSQQTTKTAHFIFHTCIWQ